MTGPKTGGRSSLRQVDGLQERRKTWVRAKWIVNGIDSEMSERWNGWERTFPVPPISDA
jgi:hypothetical protein